MIDELTVCFACSGETYNQLNDIKLGESVIINGIRLFRFDGRYFANTYNIIINREVFGTLKFNLNQGQTESNLFSNGCYKVWISIENQKLYTEFVPTLTNVATSLQLKAHNITSLDLCLDTPFRVSTPVRRYLRDESITVFLNGKAKHDKEEDTPEIIYTFSGSLARYNKYQTICIKQKKAARKGKREGITITTYDKKAEIISYSKKDYILDYYGNPKTLYRTELHLNNEDVMKYIGSNGIDFSLGIITDQTLREAMYFHYLSRVLRFKQGKKELTWQMILGRPLAGL